MNIEEIRAEMKTITLRDIVKYLERHERLKAKELAVKIGMDINGYYNIKANRRKMLTREQWDNIMFAYMIYRFNDSVEVLENDRPKQLLHPKINWVKRINKLMKQLENIDSEKIKECLSMLKICEEKNQYVVSYKRITYNPIAKSGNTQIIFLSNILLDFLSQILIILEEEKNNEMEKGRKFGENFKNVMKAFSLAMELKRDIITY